MEFLPSLAHLLISPYTHLAVMILALLITLFLKKHRWSRIVAYVLSAWLFLFIFLPIPDWWVRHYEQQYAPLDLNDFDTSRDYSIVILGAGKTSDPELPPLSQLGETASLRLAEGVRLYRQLPVSCFFTSGKTYYGSIPQGKVMADAAVSLGISPFDTLQLNTTTNTQSEARHIASVLSPDQVLIVVTSAIHMPRAVYWFDDYYGIEVIAAPTDYLIKDDPRAPDYFWEGWTKRVEYLQKGLHESVGMLYAKWFH